MILPYWLCIADAAMPAHSVQTSEAEDNSSDEDCQGVEGTNGNLNLD